MGAIKPDQIRSIQITSTILISQQPHYPHTGDFDHNGVDDVAYLTGLLKEAKRTLRIDPKRVYVIGHSNGGVRACVRARARKGQFWNRLL